MLGAIAGDIIGSVYEGHPIKTKEFPLLDRRSTFTDDTVLTVAVAESILTGESYLNSIRRWGRRYPSAGYGGTFIQWLHSTNPVPYNSWGNGSAMRVSPVGFAFESLQEILEEAERTAAISHNHPEGIKGAQATALAVFVARSTRDRETLRKEIANRFGYDVYRKIDDIRPDYGFDVSCQGTVPEAVIAFLDSTSWEDAVRNAVSLGGDSDTLACIAGAIAEAFYRGIPSEIEAEIRSRLPSEMRDVLDRFATRYA